MTETSEAKAETNRQRIMLVLRNPRVRRLQLAFLGSTLGDWAFATAMVVWAYQDGGATAVGVYQAVRFIVLAVAGPIGSVLADRMSRRLFMITTDVLRAVLVGGAGLIVVADGPSWAVYVLAITAAIIGAPFRAAEAGLLTELVESPSQLTTANALSSNIESVMIFVGPALAGVIIGVSGVEEVFWLNAATFVWSTVMLLGVRAKPSDISAGPADPEDGEAKAGFWKQLSSGFGLIGRDRDLRSVAILAGSIGYAWGAMTVFMVLIAIDTLDSGPKGLGYLNSVLGVATVAGSLLILGRLSSSRLGQDLVLGVVVGWGLPLLALAAFPSAVTAVAAIVVIGLCEPLGSLGIDTIPQRLTPSAMVSRVFSAIDTCLVAPMAAGAFVTPALVDWLGLRGALAVTAAIPLVVGVTRQSRMRALDERLTAPAEMALLRDVPAFAELPAPALELLAHAADRVREAAGTTVLAEGDASDRFYLIVTGEVEVTQQGRLLRTEGPSEFFGEIGLLRDVPRTATVKTTVDSEFLVIEREDLLAAVSQTADSISAFDDVIARRLRA
ncbi:MFS transporter [Aeromicrobium panaciterrae]|uniref:MFS transporter n=1 Tax=Aeromicrobium panaciterrae TaxID=363861 RepID=UPI0031D63B02